MEARASATEVSDWAAAMSDYDDHSMDDAHPDVSARILTRAHVLRRRGFVELLALESAAQIGFPGCLRPTQSFLMISGCLAVARGRREERLLPVR